MADNLHGDDAVVTEQTCGICLEDSKDPLGLPCGHAFCAGCLNEWRSRYGVGEEMRRKCPICRARIPPSKEMVTALLAWRTSKQRLEDRNETSSEGYHYACKALAKAENEVGADWDGVTVLQDSNDQPPVVMPDYIETAFLNRDIKKVLRWINADRNEDRVNAFSSAKLMSTPALAFASAGGQLESMTLLLQQGANVNTRDSRGNTAISMVFTPRSLEIGFANEGARLLLSWGASFFSDNGVSREDCISVARIHGRHELANLLESELGGRRCEIVNLTSRPELNGKTCVADEYLPDSNQYKVTLETKNEEKLILNAGNLKRRDRTPQDCGYFVEYKYGHMIVHDFDSSEECQAFVAETQPVVTKEAVARAEQAAAELLAELGLDDSQVFKVLTSNDQAKRSKKKKGGKKKMRKM